MTEANGSVASAVTIAQLPCPVTEPTVMAALDAIFFAASNTRSFDSPAARSTFHRRWLGRYLDGDDVAFAARIDQRIVGYVVGSLRDPAQDLRFADIGYFPLLADLTARHPAHLHVNVADDCRGRGIGHQLIAAFSAAARGGGAVGVHIVTSESAQNVGFYRRCGFEVLRCFEWAGTSLLMMGRPV